MSIQEYHRSQIDWLIQPVRPPSQVSVLVSVRFGIRCVLLRVGAAKPPAKSLCLQDNAFWCV